MAERALGEWLNYLERLHPTEIDLGLVRVEQVARQLNLLPYANAVVTVAGTNGKGSVVYTCEAILRSAGRRTGRYTSPHLRRYNERIAIDGQDVDDATIVTAFETIERARGNTTLTYFEFATLAALWIFADSAVDIVILEVGLGGRLDAVNVVDCDVAVITSIDLDHQHWLGDTVELIAPEKAAVARRDKPVVLAEADYPNSLFETLATIGARCLHAGDDWLWSVEAGELALWMNPDLEPLRVPLPNGLRPENVAAAIRACGCLLGEALHKHDVVRALSELQVPARREHTLFAGRELVLDVAHNPAAMQALASHLRENPINGQTVAIFGLMSDKDLPAMARALATAVDGVCALAIPGIDRAEQPETVWRELDRAGVAIPQSEFSAEAVLDQLLAGTTGDDRIIICGSFHSVATVLEVTDRRIRLAEIAGAQRERSALGGVCG